jgi:ATP-dependent Clp protease ATP-binding subunit ClpA
MRRLAPDAREAVVRAAAAEARRRGEGYVGTEHLLLGLLVDPIGPGARAIGVEVEEARDALRRLDGQALESVGIIADLAPSMGRSPRRRHLPFTNGTKLVLRRAMEEAAGLEERTITLRHLLVGILAAEPPDQAVRLLRFLGRDPEAIRASLP